MYEGSSAVTFQAWNERRTAERFESNLPVLLLECSDRPLRTPLTGQLLDISRMGIRLCVWHDVPIGTDLSLCLDYNGYDSLCVGEVVWRRETTASMIYGVRIKHWTLLDPNLAISLKSLETRVHQTPEPRPKLVVATSAA